MLPDIADDHFARGLVKKECDTNGVTRLGTDAVADVFPQFHACASVIHFIVCGKHVHGDFRLVRVVSELTTLPARMIEVGTALHASAGIRLRLFRASTRASQRENFRRRASVAPARPAASSLKAHNGENSGGDGGSARGRTTACGQDGSDFVTRMCSRFWMGQPTCRGNTF